MPYVWGILSIIFFIISLTMFIGIFNPKIINKRLKESQTPFTRKRATVYWVVSGIVFIILVGLANPTKSTGTLASSAVIPTASPIVTIAPTPKPTIDPAAQKAIDDKAKADAAAKVIADKAAKDKADADAKALADKKNKMLADATANLASKTDEVTDLTWYKDKSSPIYLNRNGLFLTFDKDKSGAIGNLRLEIQYTGDDWVFINKYIIKVDDQTFEIDPAYGEVKQDNGDGGVWEYYDIPATVDNLKIAKAIAASTKTIIRYQGDQHYFDRVVTSDEKKAITDVLDAYTVMGGIE